MVNSKNQSPNIRLVVKTSIRNYVLMLISSLIGLAVIESILHLRGWSNKLLFGFGLVVFFLFLRIIEYQFTKKTLSLVMLGREHEGPDGRFIFFMNICLLIFVLLLAFFKSPI